MIKKILTLNAAFACLFGVSIFFFFDSQLDNLLGKFIRIHPSFTGGELAADFIEATGENDSLDYIHYTVFKPVTNAKWVDNPEYWQLVLEYKNNSEALKSFASHIDFDNIKNYKNYNWDYAIEFSEGQGKIYDSENNFVCTPQLIILEKENQIKIRIPLKDQGLQRILGAKKTWHYLLVNGKPVFTNMNAQPLEADMEEEGKAKDNNSAKEDQAYIKQTKEIFAEAMEGDFDSNSIEENLDFYKNKIDENPNDFVSLANYGSNLAKKGGNSSVVQAVILVNQSYTYLDKAAKLARGKEGEVEVLLNRASVSASVPEQVFAKSESGAEDFVRLASLTDDAEFKAYCYAMACDCYQKCGKTTLAKVALQKSKKVLE
ncbi:MAG TPA: hypothetical protein DCZ76_10010 [Treponema sp.]|nr:hypothetical protein [Treponema sp.]